MARLANQNTATELVVRVMVESDGYLLLRYVEQGDYWCIPEGDVNPGEHIEVAVHRVCRDNLGIEIDDDPEFACVGENSYRDAAGERHLQLNFAFDVSTNQPGDITDFAPDGSRYLWVYHTDVGELDIRPAALWTGWRECLGQTYPAWVPETD